MGKKYIWLALVALLICGCGTKESRLEKANRKLGSKQNPVKMFFVPSLEAGKVVSSGEAIASFLEKETNLHFKVADRKSVV